MERRKALAAATAATLFLGSSIVAGASVSGASFLGFGGGPKRATATVGADGGVLVKTRNVYDRYVVETGSGATTDATAAGSASYGATGAALRNFTSTLAPSPSSEPTSPTTKPKPSSHDDESEPGTTHKKPAAHSDSPATTVAPVAAAPTSTPTTAVTIPPTTTTTWPRGVPKDWPKNQPIPPMPPNCEHPQLEDNGVWNCEH